MLISHIDETCVDQECTFQGRIDQKRGSGKIQFVVLRDGTGYLETVIQMKSDEENNTEKSSVKVGGKKPEETTGVSKEQFDALKDCGIESAVQLTGKLVKHFKKEGEYELQVSDLKVLSIAKDYPLGQKEHGPEFLFDHRHLYLRSKSQWAIQRIRDTIIHATYDWMREHEYTKIDSPIFTPTCAEDSTELYEVEHTNGEQMFLSQTGQMYIEAAIAGHRNVYDFGPVFRAEKSKTRRHLNELRMMDAETAFCDNEMNMNIQEELIKFIVSEVLLYRQKELKILGRDIEKLTKVITTPFPRKLHVDIVKELQSMGSDIKEGEDLGADDETMLMNKYEVPLFVTNYPLEIKAFYMPEDPDHPGTAKCADLLAPDGHGEIIGGSERLGDYEQLKQRIINRGYDLKDYERYLDIRKYGGVTTSGFGFGLERLVRWICNLDHIRESIPFPRYHNRITP